MKGSVFDFDDCFFSWKKSLKRCLTFYHLQISECVGDIFINFNFSIRLDLISLFVKFVYKIDSKIVIVEFFRSLGGLAENTDQFRSHSNLLDNRNRTQKWDESH